MHRERRNGPTIASRTYDLAIEIKGYHARIQEHERAVGADFDGDLHAMMLDALDALLLRYAARIGTTDLAEALDEALSATADR